MIYLELVHRDHKGSIKLHRIDEETVLQEYPTRVQDENILGCERVAQFADVCLCFDADGVYRGFAYKHAKQLEQLLEIVQQEEEEEEIYMVLEPYTELQKRQRIDPRDTVCARLLGAKMGFWFYLFVRRFFVLQVICVLTIVSIQAALVNLLLPEWRTRNINLEFAIYIWAGFLIQVWFFFDVMLMNVAILKQLVRCFEFWYMIFFASMSYIGFGRAFQEDPGRQHFIFSVLFGLTLFSATADAIHPSIRQRNLQLAGAFAIVIIGLSLILFIGYFSPRNFKQPINTDAIFEWEVGDHVTRQFGLTVGLDWGISQMIWLLRFIYNTVVNPRKLIIFRPTMKPEYYTRREIMALRFKKRQQNEHLAKAHLSFLVEGKTFLLDQETERFEISATKPTTATLRKVAVEQCEEKQLTCLCFWKELRESGRVTFDSKVNKRKNVKVDNRLHVLSLEGAYVDDIVVINSKHTVGYQFFGRRFARTYFKFAKRSQWVVFVTPILFMCYGISFAHIFSSSFREVTNDSLGLIVDLTGFLGMLVGVHLILMMNYPLVCQLSRTFQTLFKLYLTIFSYGAFAYMFGFRDGARTTGLRGLLMIANAIGCLSGIVFHDAIHPGSRQRFKKFHLVFVPPLLVAISMGIGFWFFSHELERPIDVKVIFSLNLGQEIRLDVDLYAMALPKLILVCIYFIRHATSQFYSQGTCTDIKSQCELSTVHVTNFEKGEPRKRNNKQTILHAICTADDASFKKVHPLHRIKY